MHLKKIGIKMNFQAGSQMDLMLEKKENQALEIIKKELAGARNPFILFDGKTGSLVTLHLLRKVNESRIPIPVLHIDTSVEFKEIYQYIEKMRKLWGFKLIRERNEEALKTIKFAEDKEKCCTILKTDALKKAIKKHNIDRLFSFEDDEIKASEPFIIHGQNTIVYPIKHFCKEDIWTYIKKYNLPYCSLYDKGYIDLRCTLCTDLVRPKEESFKKQEEEEIKKRLKALGYM